MDDPNQPKDEGAEDFAARMARAVFGRRYIDTRRVEQVLRDGEIVFQDKGRGRRSPPR